MASPCAIEREQLLQLISWYKATKRISLSVLRVCVQKTSEKIVDFVCCQDLCAKRERSVQLLVAVKVFGGSLRKFSPEKILGSPACFEEIWSFADQDRREDTLLLGKVLFLNTRFMATGRAATTAQGQFIATRTYRWCCRKLEVRWWYPFVVTAARRLTTDESCLSILPSCKWVFCGVDFVFLTMFFGRPSSVILSVTHNQWMHRMHAVSIPVVLKVAHNVHISVWLCSPHTSYQKQENQLGGILIFFPGVHPPTKAIAKSRDLHDEQEKPLKTWLSGCVSPLEYRKTP